MEDIDVRFDFTPTLHCFRLNLIEVLRYLADISAIFNFGFDLDHQKEVRN